MEEIKDATEQQVVKNLPAVRQWCSTGCTVLDLAIANQIPGGIPIGRIVQVYGGSSTCKSVLASTVLGYAQRNDMLAYYDDVEHTLDPAFAEMYGLDCSDEKTLTMLQSCTLEQLFDENIKNIVTDKKIMKKNKVMAVDSITALPSVSELDADMAKGTYGMMRAKQISVGLRKYNFALANNNMTLFVVDQTRDNVSGYGKAEITSGGRGMEFYSSVRIYLKHDTKIVNTKDRTIGMWVKFVIEKNKVGVPYRSGRFKILFSYGLDDISSNLYFLSEIQHGLDKAKNKTTLIKFKGEEKKMATWVSYIEDQNLEKELIDEVVEVWRETYKSEDRKVRKW